MHKILAALHLDDPASLKRALTTALSAMALLSLNPILTKLGMAPVSDATVASVAGLITIFVLQSGLKSKAVAVANLTARHAEHAAIRPPVPTVHAPAKR